MSRLCMLAVTVLVFAAPAQAQNLPKDVKRSFDTFTEDTIYTTKYGRLDNPQSCRRDAIALEWALLRGKLGEREWLYYDWIMIDAPFSPKAHWLNAIQAVLSIDGTFVELEKHPLTPQLAGGGKEFREKGQFRLPAGTFERILAAQTVKVRFAGTELTCDGTIEQNMITRLRAVVEFVKHGTS